MTPLQVNYTGQWLGPVQFAVSERVGIAGVQVNGINPISIPAGLWMENSFVYNETGAPNGGLTTLSFPNLVGLTNGNLAITNMVALTSLSFPSLSYVGGNIVPATMAALATLSFPSLSYVGGGFAPGPFTTLTTLACPALTYVGASFNPSTMASMTALSFPSLTYVGVGFSPGTMASMTTLSFPSLAYVGGPVNITSMAGLTSLTMPSARYYGGLISAFTGLGNLVSITIGTIGTLKAVVGATINISFQKLDQASVNGILALLVSLDGNNGTTLWGAGKTVNLSGGTSAAPAGQGIVDKATLVARGATVTTN